MCLCVPFSLSLPIVPALTRPHLISVALRLTMQFYVHQQRSPGGTVMAVRVFVVFSTQQGAAVAIRKMHGRFFAGREVRAAAYDYATFARGMLDA